MLFEVYLGLGSNLGNRAGNISEGLRMLARTGRVAAVSSIYETVAQGFQGQPRFLNVACRMWTRQDPHRLLATVKDIEAAAAKRRVFVNGPRTLDIDILLHGRAVMEVPGLVVPHPRMAARAFVLVPLAEIAPGLRHPVLGDTIRSMLTRVASSGDAVKRLSSTPFNRLHDV